MTALWIPAALVNPDPPGAPPATPQVMMANPGAVTPLIRWYAHVRAQNGAPITPNVRAAAPSFRPAFTFGPQAAFPSFAPSVQSQASLPYGTLVFLDAWTYGAPVPGYSSGKPDHRWYRLTGLPCNLDAPGTVSEALSYPFAADTAFTQRFGTLFDGEPGIEGYAPYYGKYHPGEDWAKNKRPLPVQAVGTSLLRASYQGGTGYIWVLEHPSYSASGKKLITQFHHMAVKGTVGTIYDRGAAIGSTAEMGFPHLHWAMRLADAKGADSTRLARLESPRVHQTGYYLSQADIGLDGYICPSCVVKRGLCQKPPHANCACPPLA